ncbi:uncharacterized protein GGS22DRAFT_173591 [Annulohypoxylon maeteangense]|uniref:uncharacterized protein n=1 Tax=Annulohypoxylon maeteangense TaxID=1927788 RepID=UPI00200810EC|nr:uncharacterized protein GGS22DRAFT_173591 [Annulohypoxylon maeteangense]KAI0880845.1 hypothetical protein GGS22DRAFT_173591 [Annulohypoxylon maeteangense]
MMTIPEDQQRNYEIFRDCLSTALIEKISQPEPKTKRKFRSKKHSTGSPVQSRNATTTPHLGVDAKAQTEAKAQIEAEVEADPDLSNADSLADFADYIAAETFPALPAELKTLDYYSYVKDTDLQSRYALPLTGFDTPLLLPSLDPSVADSLSAYAITSEPTQGVDEFLAPILTSYLTSLSTPPPAPRATLREAEGCELCGRDWINLSYHHLIPRYVHAKAVRRGWHREEDLQNVAWLCGACHRFVHRFAGHEELARKYYTVELLMEEEGVKRWVDWVGRLRWKGR